MFDTEVDYLSLIERVQGSEQVYNQRMHEIGTEFREAQSLFVKSIDQGKRQIHAIASTGDVDRHGEIIEPSAFRELLPVYMKNPVVIASHQHRLDNGHSSVVGSVVKAWIDKAGLNVIIEFEDETELGREYWTLYSKKRQRAFSVGFNPMDWKYEERDGVKVRIYTRVELLEISCVVVGSNRGSLSKSRQRKSEFVSEKALLRNMGIDEEQWEKECDEFAEALLSGEYEDGYIENSEESIGASEPDYSSVIKCSCSGESYV